MREWARRGAYRPAPDSTDDWHSVYTRQEPNLTEAALVQQRLRPSEIGFEEALLFSSAIRSALYL